MKVKVTTQVTLEKQLSNNITMKDKKTEQSEPIIKSYSQTTIEQDFNNSLKKKIKNPRQLGMTETQVNIILQETYNEIFNFVTFEHPTKESTEAIMKFYNRQSEINNTYSDNKCLYFLGEFFKIGTKFYKDKVETKDKTYMIIDNKLELIQSNTK